MLLPTPRPEDSAQLDLVAPANKPGGRNRKLAAAPSRALERPVHRSIGSHLNNTMRNGGVWHPVNEQALLSLLEPERRRAYQQAMIADGLLPGVTDFIAMWEFPPEWRAILTAAGVELPPLMALCGGVEVKAPGWKADKEWRAGSQPKAHALLNSWGVPTAIVQSFVEAHDIVESWGARMKFRILTARGQIGGVKVPSKVNTEGGQKKKATPKTARARRVPTDAPQAETASSATRKLGFRSHESK